MFSVPGFSNFVFRVLVFRRSGVPAFHLLVQAPEETVVVFVQCFHTDVAKTSISNCCRVETAFSGELPQARTVLLFGSYSGQIFPRRNLLTRRRK